MHDRSEKQLMKEQHDWNTFPWRSRCYSDDWLVNSKVLCNWQSNTFTRHLTDNCQLATFLMRILARDGTIEPVKHVLNNADLRETMSDLVGRMTEGHWLYERFRTNSRSFGKNYIKSSSPKNIDWLTIWQWSSWKLHWLSGIINNMWKIFGKLFYSIWRWSEYIPCKTR
jgi:hypothetical protein